MPYLRAGHQVPCCHGRGPGLGDAKTWQRKDTRDSTDPYQHAHDQVVQAKGKASEHRCTDCSEQAEEWSLVADPIGETAPVNHNGLAYWISDSTADYQPRCVPCHREADAQLRLEFEGSWESVLNPPAYNSEGYRSWT